MKLLLPAFALATALPLSAGAQTLREHFSDLFRFGNCGQILCLASTGGHGDHFIPSSVAGTADVMNYLTNAVGAQAANLPISATTSGVTYSLVRGVPVQSTTSAGPIFGERANTLGKGRSLVGLTVNYMSFTQLRGTNLSALDFNFTHQDNDPPGLGDPSFENDVINVKTNVSLKLLMTSFVFTYGVSDRVDFGVAIPMVNSSLSGTSRAQIVSSLAVSPHYFGGTAANPITSAVTSTDASSFGIGDIAVRLKGNLSPSGSKTSLGLLGDVRLGTGSVENFQGTGGTTARLLAIASRDMGAFTPHANAGFAMRSGDWLTNSIIANAGFDKLLAAHATLAVDILSEFQAGNDPITLPSPMTIGGKTVAITNLENKRNDFVHASFGLKFSTNKGLTGIFNAVVPLMNSGLRPNAVLTAGLEYGF